MSGQGDIGDDAVDGRTKRNWWRVIGIALTVGLLAGALFVLAGIVVLWIGMANYGSNK